MSHLNTHIMLFLFSQSSDFSDITNWPTPGELAKEVWHIVCICVRKCVFYCSYTFFKSSKFGLVASTGLDKC